MSNPIDELPTEAEREAARKIATILEPLSSDERRQLIEKAMLALQLKRIASNFTGATD